MNRHGLTQRRLLFVALPAAAVLIGGAGVAVAATGAGHGDGNDQPTYHSSVTTTSADDSGTAAAQDRTLVRLATVTLPQAAQAAGQAVPGGTVISIDLGNEGGNVVYTAGVVTAAGAETEVVVDAGDGRVLAKQVDNETNDRRDGSPDNDGTAPATGGGSSQTPTGTSTPTHP